MVGEGDKVTFFTSEVGRECRCFSTRGLQALLFADDGNAVSAIMKRGRQCSISISVCRRDFGGDSTVAGQFRWQLGI